MKAFLISLSITIVCGIISVYLLFSDYNQYQNFDVTAVNVVESSGRHSSTFYGVFKFNKDYYFSHDSYSFKQGELFDIPISATTYSQFKEGNQYLFNLRPFDIKQTPKLNVIYFFGMVIFFAAYIVGVFVTLYDFIVYRNKTK